MHQTPAYPRILTTLGLGDTHGASMTAGSLCVLSADTQSQGMTHATMHANLFQSLKVFTQLVVPVVGQELRVRAVLDVLLTIQKVLWDAVAQGVLHDVDELVEFVLGALAGTFCQGDSRTTAHQARVATPDTGDRRQGILDLLLAVDVCVEDAEDVLEGGPLVLDVCRRL